MELIGLKYGGSCSFDGCWWNCIVALTLFWNLLSLIWYNHTLEIHPLDMPPKTSPMYQVCFSKSWWLLRVSHPKILVQYIVNLKLPLGLKNPGGFVPVRMRHRVSRWIFFSSTPWRRRNALFLIMWLGRSGREKPCGHRGCWSFYNFFGSRWCVQTCFIEESQALGFDRRSKGNQVAKGNDWIEEIWRHLLKMYQTL